MFSQIDVNYVFLAVISLISQENRTNLSLLAPSNSNLPDLNCHIPWATDNCVGIQEGTSTDYIMMATQNKLGFPCRVVPDPEWVIFATCDQLLMIPWIINWTNTHAMATEQVNCFCKEVSNSALGHICILSSIKEYTIIPWNGLHAVNNIVQKCWVR